jgi:phosphoglycolate phosphatase
LRLIVFDLDGTLIDSRRDLADAANALIVERGGPPLPVDMIASMVGEGTPLLVSRALTAAGLEPELDTALPRFLALYDERLLAHTTLYPGTREMLESLAPAAALAILTNKPQRPTERIVKELGIGSFFRWTIGGDTAHGRKPNPGGLNHLMSVAGVGIDTTIIVGDSAIDLRTARAAGTRICLVKYGFGFTTVSGLLTANEMVADSASALTRLLQDEDGPHLS